MAWVNAQPHESRLYYEFSHLYDLIFRRVFYPRIARVIRSLDIEPAARVLELGVGTGLSLDAYPSHCHVTGIDLAPDMLERAQDKVNTNGWRHISLEQGDALNLRFADDSFDYVMAFHVVSVVPDPVRMMDEARRVCRPGGVLTIINHFRSPNRAVSRLLRTIDPVTRWLGWTTLRLPDVLDRRTLHVERQWKTSRHSLFTIVVARNVKPVAGRESALDTAGERAD
ncbi:MAG TPA: class I SAM-dependent methyltransferase [Candidatus Binatia bacterium]|jgi:phosphatidylethanolamine/phosphatidyl-N-methylethanolamine N-methyltransferase|nr:class I SAM-dependent methyltransferase [Candidatus Binatia bacterium]